MASLISIGRRIANLRAEKGFSQEDLAGLADVNRGYISRIENGHVDFSVSVLLKIARAFGLEAKDLL